MNRQLYLIVIYLLILLAPIASASDSYSQWSWYFAGISSRSPVTELFTRTGNATVLVDRSIVRISFSEPRMSEYSAEFNGIVSEHGAIRGTLDGFFLHGEEIWTGYYVTSSSSEDCTWEEVLLRSGTPDGSVLVLSRASGICE